MVYERARTWLEGKNIQTREDAERYLTNIGEDINKNVWASTLDAIYPTAEITTIQAGFALGQAQEEEMKQPPQELSFLDRAGRLVRRILRGQI